jgi:hypothetical protein
MIEKCKLSNFIAEKKPDDQFDPKIKMIKENRNHYPKLFMLVTDTAKFCETYFSELLLLVRREKRLLGFQTPNRIKFDHEYTISKNSLTSDFYYLFTPSGRLDWLTIYLEEEKVSIADKNVVKNKILNIVKDEITAAGTRINYQPNEFISILYETLTGLPCFIEFNQTEKIKSQQSIIITIEYFESITPVENKKNIFTEAKILFSPLLEKKITYQYIPLSQKYNSWLYLNAPKNFEIYCNISGNDLNIEAPKTKDPEIASYVMKGDDSYHIYSFEIKITVPSSLKIWYKALYFLALFYSIGLILYFVDKIDLMTRIKYLNFLSFTHDRISIFDKGTISNISLAIIAGIIATRGWLIIEENVLQNISKKFTYFLLILTFLTLIINYM